MLLLLPLLLVLVVGWVTEIMRAPTALTWTNVSRLTNIGCGLVARWRRLAAEAVAASSRRSIAAVSQTLRAARRSRSAVGLSSSCGAAVHHPPGSQTIRPY